MCTEPIRSREVEQRKLKRVTQMRVKIKDQTKLLLTILRERPITALKIKRMQIKIQNLRFMTPSWVVNSEEL